jgi:hypothetical protein
MSTTPAPPPMTSSPPATPAQPASVGVAVHADLYKVSRDPAGEARHLREEARKLGIAFFVFFSVIIGGLSLWMNGALHGVTGDAAAVVTLGRAQRDPRHPGPLGRVQAVWSDGTTNDALEVDYEGVTLDDTPLAHENRVAHEKDLRAKGNVPVSLFTGEGTPVLYATAWVPRVQKARVRAVIHGGVQDPTRPWPRVALDRARLLKVVPTRIAISLGAIFGLLGVLVPAALVPFYGFWMAYVAAPLGWFNTRLILAVVFFVLFTPFALVLAIKRAMNPEKDMLRRAARPGSYWVKREQQRPRTHFERTF